MRRNHQTLIAIFCLAALSSIGLNSCKPQSTIAKSKSVSDYFDPGTIEKYLVNFIFKFADFNGLCSFTAELSQTVGDRSSAQCLAGFQSGLCKQVVKDTANDLGTVIDGFNDSETSEIDGPAQLLNEIQQGVISCVKSMEKETLVELGKKYATRLGIDAGSELIKNRDLKRNLANWACTGASKAIGDAISKQRTVDFENACGGALGGRSSEASKSQIGSCFRTAGSICSIVVEQGKVNLDNFLPATDDLGYAADTAVDVAKELASEVVSNACQLGSVVTRGACGAINAAAAQIKEALVSGDNDWANCVGTSQLGACIGSKIGSGGWTNNNGAETATEADDGNGGKFSYVGCCLCERQEFARGFYANNIIASLNVISVIQQGDYDSGNCAYRQNRGDFTMSGSSSVFRYSRCDKVFLAGNRCAPDNSGFASVWNGASYDRVGVTVR